jgi:large subunit ribosomal protein L19
MFELIQKVEQKYRKHAVVDVRTGDTVKVYQKVREGSKERVQMFEGVVIRTDRKDSLSSSITVRRIASGVGVEKTYLLHSPLVTKVEVVKRSKVRRKYLTYLRERSGKSARLTAIAFDKDGVNTLPEKPEVVEQPEVELADKQEAPVAEAEAKK